MEEIWTALSRNQRHVLVAAFANFLLFLIGYLLIGGDSLQGQQFDGRYWVANKGNLREVSKATHHYSTLHLMSLLVSHPLAIAMCVVGRNKALRAREHPISD